MKTVFADTYYFLAVGNKHNSGHARAVQFAAQYRGPIVTTEWVLTEVGDALAAPVLRSRFLNVLQVIAIDENWMVVPSTSELFKRGVALFSKRTDKAWSLTDCISFVVMQEQRITEALTADHHFEQPGFIPLFA